MWFCPPNSFWILPWPLQIFYCKKMSRRTTGGDGGGRLGDSGGRQDTRQEEEEGGCPEGNQELDDKSCHLTLSWDAGVQHATDNVASLRLQRRFRSETALWVRCRPKCGYNEHSSQWWCCHLDSVHINSFCLFGCLTVSAYLSVCLHIVLRHLNTFLATSTVLFVWFLHLFVCCVS